VQVCVSVIRARLQMWTSVPRGMEVVSSVASTATAATPAAATPASSSHQTSSTAKVNPLSTAIVQCVQKKSEPPNILH